MAECRHDFKEHSLSASCPLVHLISNNRFYIKTSSLIIILCISDITEIIINESDLIASNILII